MKHSFTRGLQGLLLFFLALPALGKTSSSGLSYEEFTRLSLKDRAAYVQDMQKVLLQMEAEQNPSASLWQKLLGAEAWAAAGGSCIFAGYISTYNSQGVCQAPASRDWSVPNASGQVVQKNLCSGQTLCNPMIYGFGPDGNGICTASTMYPTLDCDKKYRAIKNYGGAQIAQQLANANLKSDFNNQSQQISNYCGSSNQQSSICQYYSSRTSYLKAKVASAKSKEVVTPTSTIPAEIAKPEPSLSPSPSPSPAPSLSPSASLPAEKAVAKEETDKKEKKEKKPSADGCIHTKTDYEAYKSKLSEGLQKLEAGPVYFGLSNMFVMGALQLRLVNDRLKMSFNVWPPRSFSDGKVIVTEKYISKACFVDKTRMRVYFDGDSQPHDMTMTDHGLTIHSSSGDGDFSYVGKNTYDNYRGQIVKAYQQQKSEGGGQ